MRWCHWQLVASAGHGTDDKAVRPFHRDIPLPAAPRQAFAATKAEGAARRYLEPNHPGRSIAEVQLLAWHVMEDSRPFRVMHACVWARLESADGAPRWSLLQLFGPPDESWWGVSYVDDAEFYGERCFDRRPGNAEVYDFLSQPILSPRDRTLSKDRAAIRPEPVNEVVTCTFALCRSAHRIPPRCRRGESPRILTGRCMPRSRRTWTCCPAAGPRRYTFSSFAVASHWSVPRPMPTVPSNAMAAIAPLEKSIAAAWPPIKAAVRWPTSGA
jgi:hypothetical protein